MVKTRQFRSSRIFGVMLPVVFAAAVAAPAAAQQPQPQPLPQTQGINLGF